MVRQIVNSIYNSNTFILDGSNNHFWLIDCGDIPPVLEMIGANGIIDGVLFTHTHYDHIYGINTLLECFPKAKIYTNEFGKMALQSPKLNYSKYHQEAEPIICSHPENIIVVCEGDKIEINDGICVSIIETPGHDKSCICYQTSDCFFSGDSFIPGVKVFSNFLHGNKEEAFVSQERIKMLCSGKVLYPGHELVMKP